MDIKIPTLADTVVSNKGRYYGAGDRTRTGTLSPAVDFESTTSTIPSHRQVYLNSILHYFQNSKKKVYILEYFKKLYFPCIFVYNAHKQICTGGASS